MLEHPWHGGVGSGEDPYSFTSSVVSASERPFVS